MGDREPAKRTLLRVLCVSTGVLALASFVVAFLPGAQLYDIDGTHYIYVATRPVVEHWRWLAGFLVILCAPGVIVWRAPKIAYALLWSMWAIALAILGFIATFDVGEWTMRRVSLWPEQLFGTLMLGLMFVLVAIIPIACAVFWWITHERREPPIPLARARVVR